MTLMNTSDTRAGCPETFGGTQQGRSQGGEQQQTQKETNVANTERAVSVAAGSLLAPVRLRCAPKLRHDGTCEPPASDNEGGPEVNLSAEGNSGELTLAECLACKRRLLLRGEPGKGRAGGRFARGAGGGIGGELDARVIGNQTLHG